MWLFLAILAVPFIEIALFVVIGGVIGVWATLAWVGVSALLGFAVLRSLGLEGAVSLRRDMQQMRDPLAPLAHRAVQVLAAMLLMLPGFLTDAIGLVLLIPPIRIAVIALVASRVHIVTPQGGGQADIIEGEWEDLSPDQAPKPRDRPSGWTQH